MFNPFKAVGEFARDAIMETPLEVVGRRAFGAATLMGLILISCHSNPNAANVIEILSEDDNDDSKNDDTSAVEVECTVE